jgi:hypothetical protein
VKRVVVALVLVACSSSPVPEPEPPPAIATAPAPAPPEPADPVEPVPPSASSAEPEKPAHAGGTPPAATTRPLLGAACPPPGALTPDPCGTQGRVALEVDTHTVALARNAECELVALGRPPPGVNAPSACLEGDVLYAANACIACRLVGAGWSAKARVAELTAAQALEVQKQLGLPATRPFTSADEWRRALAAARQSP